MHVALALGSGGARGYAHIGVIAELKARGHDIAAIAGTSMGSVVGGLEAAGRLDDFTAWVLTLSQRDVIRLLDPVLRGPGMIRAERVMARVEEILGPLRIEDLPIPFTAVATDLTARREVWFQRGPATRAMRASIAIPSAITPVMINGRLLADGGLLNPVPMEPLLGAPADFTVAVNLSGRSRRPEAPLVQSSDQLDPDWGDRIREAAAGFMDTDVFRFISDRVSSLAGRGAPGSASPASPSDASPSDASPSDAPASGTAPTRPASGAPASQTTSDAAASGTPVAQAEEVDRFAFQELPPALRTSDVIALSLDTTQALVTRVRMAANPPDVLVDVPLDSARTWDFHRAAEQIEVGRTLAVAALDAAGF